MANETSRLIWSIGSHDGRSEQLVDNYKDPNMLGDVVWRVGTSPGEGPQRWPLFHPSEADPEAGYRLHPYTILFPLEAEPQGAYVLRIEYLVIAPRLASLELRVNGVTGHAYLRPSPSKSGEIRLLSGLHTTIYSDGVCEVVIPASMLQRGENRLELIARDAGETIVVERIEAIKRLDRMANGAGFLYQWIGLFAGEDSVCRAEIQPTVVYRKLPTGGMVEQCRLYVELGAEALPAGEWRLGLRDGANSDWITFDVPATSFGHLELPFDLFDGDGAVDWELISDAGRFSGTFERRRKWKVFITPHAHTDIGYTHRQWEVAERLCRNVDFALDQIAADTTGSFTYHLDSSWVLETYLATRSPERRKQFFAAVKAGRIGVAANYVDLLTQTSALEDLIRNHETTEAMIRPEGATSDFIAVVDVASITGSMPALLEGAGIRYIAHADNQDRGPFRLNGGLNRVSPFWWEGVNGGRVLVWLSKMYCELRKVCGSPPVPYSAQQGFQMWLQEYEHEGYAPDAVLLYGQEADNTDMDPQPIDFVRQWNATYAYPQLIASDVSSFFHYVEERWADKFVTVRGDSGAYWEDGVGSSIEPTIRVREAQASLPAAERLESLAAIHTPGWAFPAGQFDEAWRQVLLYDEHTWGAFMSAREPEAWLTRDQWEVKEGFADGAHSWAKRLLHVAAVRHSLNWNNDGREVIVYNPHSWTVSGPCLVEIEPNERVEGVPQRTVQALSSQKTVEFWVDSLPGMAYRRFVLSRGSFSAADDADGADDTLENRSYRLRVDLKRGCVVSLFDKELGRELVDGSDAWGFGQFLYASGGENSRLISNQADLPQVDPTVSTAFELISSRVTRDELGARLVLVGKVPGGELEMEWSLPEQVKKVELRCTYRKQATTAKEAVYIAFPTSLGAGAKVESDSHLGWVDWDKDQLPGGCKEWLPLQTGILVSSGDATVHIASPDIPLFCVRDVVKGHWPKELDLTGGRVLSYVLNNYWHTNYKGTQGGEITFRYAITSGARVEKADAYRLGWEARRPLYAHRMSFQDFRPVREPYASPAGGALATIGSENVALVTIRPARFGTGYLVRLQEIAGTVATDVPIAFEGRPVKRAFATDLLERTEKQIPVRADGSVHVSVSPWGLTTVRVEFSGH